jgi:hypothetical protein
MSFGNTWEVMKMQQSKGKLIVSTISPEEIESLEEISETPEDTIAQREFTLTKRQFKNFVKKDGFNESETFVRLR